VRPVIEELIEQGRPFALLHRVRRPGVVELLSGDLVTVPRLADLPDVPESLVLLPYRQLAERGYACHDDGTPLRAMTVHTRHELRLSDLDGYAAPPAIVDGRFDLSDAEYARLVRDVLAGEIGTGSGANFVLKRSYLGTVPGWSARAAVGSYARLLRAESGAYWTFCVHTGDRTLIGASPELHLGLERGTARMNPISGTYRYPGGGATLDGVLDFLADPKESDELYMVLDEELKVMGQICAGGGRVIGPRLKPMARLAHTEYLLEGRTDLPVPVMLRRTLLAPTVTGSPLESACRVIARHERTGRGYYSGVLGLVGTDPDGLRTLDSAIVIRTADVDAAGRLRIDVGATLVRHSDPDREAAETRAKAAALLAAFGLAGEQRAAPAADRHRALAGHPSVRRALERRNATMSGFWLRPGRHADPALTGRRVLVLDCEDTFTAMLAHQLRALGPAVTVRRYDEPGPLPDADLLLLGPGPGDPRDHADPKIAAMRAVAAARLDGGRPFLAVCLGHQVLCDLLGLPLVRRAVPNQGAQREIDLFGRPERVGFYNTYAASSATDRHRGYQVCRDRASGEVHALRGPNLWSAQFHPESVLTEHGVDILRDALRHVAPGGNADADLYLKPNRTRAHTRPGG
jgi:2-amino-4-deoxychorismate synthase